MEEKLRTDLGNFAQVWQRVGTCDAPAAQVEEQERLAAFVAREHRRQRCYERAAAAMRNSGSQILRRCAAAAGERLRALQLEHYLLCGDSCPVGRHEENVKKGLAGLRQLYWEEEQSRTEYLRAAAMATGSCQALYAHLAEDCFHQAKQLRELMGKAMR